MQLTLQQRSELERGHVVRFVIPDSNIECVIVRSDRLQMSNVDFEPCSTDELARLMSEQLEDEDWTLPDDRGFPHERSTC